jgi:hypothetical protein
MSLLELVNSTPAKFDQPGKTKFGKLKLWIIRVGVGKQHQGKFFSIPGIKADKWKIEAGKSDADGNLNFYGKQKGGNALLLVQVVTLWNAQGEPYEKIKQYTSEQFEEKPHKYNEFGMPSTRSLLGVKFDSYFETSDNVVYKSRDLWVQFEEKPTGLTMDGGSEITYWEFQELYSTEQEMRTIEESFWAKVQGGGEQEAVPASDDANPLDQLTKIPDIGGWTEQTWKDVGVPAILKGRREEKPDAEIAVNLGVAPEFVAHVLDIVPF